jgi:hypothetical protein
MKDYNEKLDFVIRSVLSRMKTMLPENVLTELCVEIEAFIQARDRELEPCKEITDEAAIEHLWRSGWMQRHEELMTVDSMAAIVNRIMRDGDKTISVNVYPWKEDDV